MKIEILLDHQSVLQNRPSIFFGARLLADGETTTAPPPKAYCLLLDRSASMRGEAFACARRFAQEFVRHLPTNARLAILAFDDTAELLFDLDTVEDKGALEAMIGEIEPGELGSNLSGAWLLGREALLAAPDGMERRLVFCTDGEPTAGLRDEPDLVRLAAQGRREQMRVSTIACGTAKAPFLAALAVAGGGEFHALSGGEDFWPILARELGGLIPVAAQNLRLRLKRLDFCDGIEPLGDHRHHGSDLGEGVVEFGLPDLLAGEERSVCFNLAVAALPCIEGEPVMTFDGEPLVEMELLYDAIRAGGIHAEALRQTIRATRTQEPGEVRLLADSISFQ